MTRLQPVRAYWRVLPDRTNTPPHLELQEAYRRDQQRSEHHRYTMQQIAADILREIDEWDLV